MTEGIITGLLAIVVCMINNIYQSKNSKEQHKKTIALIEYKLEELTKRVNKHNNLVERTYELEEKMSVVDEKLKVVNHRIEDIERIESKKG